jgi:hypothetical protein
MQTSKSTGYIRGLRLADIERIIIFMLVRVRAEPSVKEIMSALTITCVDIFRGAAQGRKA